ncbi:hypothetical protein Xvtw_03095 [Xanthomonas campestris pv. vitiswoodrowii]|nr:hypothetical protein Xvtw_03095 [Xanthomonas campestris pv. vitiswoodrowii]
MFGRKKIVFRCEACSARLIKRTSVLAHKFLRHDSYVCENPMCGATYTGHSELTGIASPSDVPTAHSELPPTPAYQRAQALQAYRESLGDRQLDLIPMGGEPFFPHL